MLTIPTILAIVFGVIAVVFLIATFVVWRIKAKNPYYCIHFSFSMVCVFVPFFALFFSFFSIFYLFYNGFGPKYWTIKENNNLTITSIDSRSTISDENGESKLTTEFAVELDGIDGVIISEDPRFLSLDKGDNVNLSCHWIWQYDAADINSCRINE